MDGLRSVEDLVARHPLRLAHFVDDPVASKDVSSTWRTQACILGYTAEFLHDVRWRDCVVGHEVPMRVPPTTLDLRGRFLLQVPSRSLIW